MGNVDAERAGKEGMSNGRTRMIKEANRAEENIEYRKGPGKQKFKI